MDYLCKYYDRIIVELGRQLNAIHGVSFSSRYWRILVGPWLFRFIHASYDRYRRLSRALDLYPEVETFVLTTDAYYVPSDTHEARECLQYDIYNLQICSQLLSAMGQEFPMKMPNPEGRLYRFTKMMKHRDQDCDSIRRACRWFRGMFLRLGHRYCHVAYGGGVDSSAFAWHLFCRKGIVAFSINEDSEWLRYLPSAGGRDRIELYLTHENEFEKAFVPLVARNLPRVYLEGFHYARGEVLKRNCIRPNVVVGASWTASEPLKFSAAEFMENGARVVVAQSGGIPYGFAHFYHDEVHELSMCDTFAAWGWAEKGSTNCQNVPALNVMLSNSDRIGIRLMEQEGENILYLATYYPRFIECLEARALDVDYRDWQLRFLRSLPRWLVGRLIFRPHPYDYAGDEFNDKIKSEFPMIGWSDASKKLHEEIVDRGVRLVIVDSQSTSFCEMMALNIPCVCFWDLGQWDVRAAAKNFLDLLLDAKIIFEDPEEAARATVKIYDNPREWWNKRDIQEARQSFVERFAFHTPNGETQNDWVRFLVRQVILSQEEVAASLDTKACSHKNQQ